MTAARPVSARVPACRFAFCTYFLNEKGCALIQDPELKPYYEELLIKQMELSRRYQKVLLETE